MPELPEVETVRRDLEQHLVGCKITEIIISNASCIKCPTQELFTARLTGRCFLSTGRRGKYLRLYLDNNEMLTVHLRMTGRLIYTSATSPIWPHTHIVFKLSNGHELRYSDTRRFGCLWLLSQDEEDCTGIQKLGLEPLDAEFNGQYLQKMLGMRKIPIKTAVLTQEAVAGLGNIYADEVLFVSGIISTRHACDLTADEWQLLAENMCSVLLDAINNRGTTFSDFLDGEGHMGNNQKFLRVYGKKNTPCPTCGTTLKYIKVGGRGTVFCPHCQK